ncbi:MAG: hypothetical protein ACYC9Q_14150 [Bacillota bacterium]
MAGRIIDLDAFAPGDIIVKLGGEEWPIPGDIPTRLWLRLLKARGPIMAVVKDAGSAGQDPNLDAEISAILGDLRGLLLTRRPDDGEKLDRVFGLRQALALIQFLAEYLTDVEAALVRPKN